MYNENVIAYGYHDWWSRELFIKRKRTLDFEAAAARAKRMKSASSSVESKWYAGDLSSRWPELKRYSCESTLNWHADDNELLRRNEETRGYFAATRVL